ncbi:MAG: ABC transporter ATP-binding protein [Steroidobacteraceae bacterium]
MTSLLAIDDLSVHYGRAPQISAAVREVTLEIGAAECLGVVGESGSGKTQLFLAAMGLLPAAAHAQGSVRFQGRELLGRPPRDINRVRGSKMTMIFQDPMTSLTPHLRIGVQLAEVLVTHSDMSWTEARQAALDMLDRVRVSEPHLRLQQYPHELSGGQRQRVMIGMSLLCGPDLVVADEPTTALDVTVQAHVMDLLRDLRAQSPLALVLISHDIGVVGEIAERVAVMYAGRVVEYGRAADVLGRARHPYTAELLKCVPNLRGPRLTRMPSLPGHPPGSSLHERGCAFAPRCTRAVDRCRAERPTLQRSAPTGVDVACHFPVSP